MSKYCDILIIGAGPAGLFTAINCAGINGVKVAILEKNPRAGRKLLITGGGQCNLTHAGPMDDFYNHYGSNSRFLRSSFNRFTNRDLLNFFMERGIDFIETVEGKILPSSLKAQDILDVLLQECRKKGVSILYNEHVQEVIQKKDQFIVNTRTNVYSSKALVIAVGGKSYPSTGSTGDGYKLASSLGHTIIEPRPGLTPLYIYDYPFGELAGISLENIEITQWRNDKKIGTWRGDVLFTHRGLSGPGILNSSRYIEPGDIVRLNFIDAPSLEKSRQELDGILTENGRQLVKTAVSTYNLPRRLMDRLISLAGISRDDRCAHLSRDKRNKLAEFLSSFPMKVEKLGGFNIAMVTCGGVSLKEIKPNNMESKLIPNLFFVGEILDIDGDTGGYNLQAAFSQGYMAGRYLKSIYSVNI